jgi:hypothetical protein
MEMATMKSFATVALAGLLAAPLSAQVAANGETVRDRVEAARRSAEQTATRAAIDSGFLRSGSRNSRSARKIPPGHLPPSGMCRVWIDGVPPGQQAPVESCTEARVRAARTANSRVVYGDDQSFPGNGRGKFDRADDDRFDDDERFDDDDRGAKLSKAEKQARKAARKAHKGRGKKGRG